MTPDLLREWRESAPYWDKYRDIIRAMFMPLTRALIEDARIIKGQSVLDVAGGAGEPSLTLAETIGPEGSVTCTDFAAEMVEAAKAAAARRGMTNITFRECSVDSLPFADRTFDVAVSRLGAMFFPDPLAALREMLRVVKPGGSVGLVVWRHSELNPFFSVTSEIVSRYVEPTPEDPDAPNAFRFAESGKLAGLLKEAGAVDVRERILKSEIAAPVALEDYWKMRSEISDTLRAKLAGLSNEQKSQIAKEVQHAAAPFFARNQMNFPSETLVVSGRKETG
ncbi:MAG: class I SAM-dependent methyltransferase [Acidobacteriota bacterium]